MKQIEEAGEKKRVADEKKKKAAEGKKKRIADIN